MTSPEHGGQHTGLLRKKGECRWRGALWLALADGERKRSETARPTGGQTDGGPDGSTETGRRGTETETQTIGEDQRMVRRWWYGVWLRGSAAVCHCVCMAPYLWMAGWLVAAMADGSRLRAGWWLRFLLLLALPLLLLLPKAAPAAGAVPERGRDLLAQCHAATLQLPPLAHSTG